MSEPQPEQRQYVLVTAAYNEEQFIEAVIKSIASQTARTIRWIIVSDGSTDRTDEIVQRYAAKFDFIELCRIDEDHPRNFAAQVHAINRGLAQLKDVNYEFIGNVDADISFDQSYFSDLLDVFAAEPNLGLAGGSIFEKQSGEFQPRPLNRTSSVAHAVQLFRRECFESLDQAYIPLPYGGPDWYAVVRSRMNGWRVRSIPELKVLHHRPPSATSGWMRASFRQGRMDYSLGTHPLFEMFRLIRRVASKPYLLRACARFSGFLFSYLTREERIVSHDFIRFLQREELQRLRHPLG